MLTLTIHEVIKKRVETKVSPKLALTKTQLSYYFTGKTIKEYFKKVSFHAVLADKFNAEFYTVKDIVKIMSKNNLELRKTSKANPNVYTYLEYERLRLELKSKPTTKSKVQKI